MKTIILGIGNPILGDDGVGIKVVKELKKHLKDPDIKLDEAATGGINLLDQMMGYDKAILIDTIKNKNIKHGEIKRLSLDDFPSFHSYNPHDISLPEACVIARQLGETRIPHDITIFGISLRSMPCEFGEEISEEISKAIPKTVDMIMSELSDDKKDTVEEL